MINYFLPIICTMFRNLSSSSRSACKHCWKQLLLKHSALTIMIRRWWRRFIIIYPLTCRTGEHLAPCRGCSSPHRCCPAGCRWRDHTCHDSLLAFLHHASCNHRKCADENFWHSSQIGVSCILKINPFSSYPLQALV